MTRPACYLLLFLHAVPAGLFAAAAPQQLRGVSVQFGWIPDMHQAGFYVAQQRGFFADEGLDVELRPGGPDAPNVIDAVLSNSADIGQADGIEQMILSWALNKRVIPFAAIHRDTPEALISLARNPIRGPEDLPGKRVAVVYGDAAEILFRAYLSRTGVNPSTVAVEAFEFDLTPLIEGRVDAVTGFRTDQPATLLQLGLEPAVLAYESAGVRSYGYTLFTSERLAFPADDLTKRFTDAARKGWTYAFEHPEQAFDILQAATEDPLDRPAELTKLALIRQIMLDGDGRLALWRLDRRVIEQAADYLVEQGLIVKVPDIPKAKAGGWGRRIGPTGNE